MNIEQKFQELSKRLSDEFRQSCSEIMSDIETDILPHCEVDTIANVEFRSEEIIKRLLAGHVTPDDDYLVIMDSNGIGVRLRVTSEQYDNLRKNLIAAMPVCPKDLEIQSLKEQIARMMDFSSRHY